MYQTANEYVITLPDESRLVFGQDLNDPDACGLIADISSATNIATNMSRISAGDGAVIGPHFLDGRSVVLNALVVGDAVERAAMLERIYTLQQALRADCYLEWREATGIRKQIRGLRLSEYPAVSHGDKPVKTVQIQLVTPQPYIVSANLHQIRDRAQGTFPVFNLGTAPAAPKFKVHGPFTSFQITNADTGEVLRVAIPGGVAAGSYVTVDCDPAKREVLINDQTNAYPYLDFSHAEFFHIQPQGSELIFSATGGAASTLLEVDWRSSWLG